MPDDPLPPEVLADALQDAAHREIGNVRPAKVKRLTPAMDSVERGLRQAERGELRDLGSFAQYADEPENVMEEARNLVGDWERDTNCYHSHETRAELIERVAAALAKRDEEVAAERTKREESEAWDVRKFAANLAEYGVLSHEDGWTLVLTAEWEAVNAAHEDQVSADALMDVVKHQQARLAKMERVVEAARDHRDRACTVPHGTLDEALADLDSPS